MSDLAQERIALNKSLAVGSAPIETARFGRMQRFIRDQAASTGALLLGLALFAAIFGPSLAPYDPAEIHTAQRLAPPNSQYWLGTDELGRDLLSRILWGARVSLTIAFTVVVVAGFIGTITGVVGGYYGGLVDVTLMRFMDLILAFPAILLALALVAVLGASLRNLIIAIGIVYIPVFARLARGSTKQVSVELYVEAARSVGARNRWIITKHVLPNIQAPLLVQATINLAYAILVEAALSFLGLGIQPPTPSWGGMLATGKAFMELSPWVALFPGLAIMLTVLGANLVGDGLRDILDPRFRY